MSQSMNANEFAANKLIWCPQAFQVESRVYYFRHIHVSEQQRFKILNFILYYR